MDRSLLIDISRLMGRVGRARLPTGVDRVCLAYLERYGDTAQAVLQWRGWRRVLGHGPSRDLFALLRSRPPSFCQDAARIVARACLPPWPPQSVPGRHYVNLGQSGLHEPGLSRWLRRSGPRPVFMVHDLIPITHPEYCRSGEAGRHAARLGLMLRAGRALVANSAATLAELETFADQRQLALPPAAVAPLAPARLGGDPGATRPLPQPYFVTLGTIEPRKNHLLLLQVWRRLVERHGPGAPHLVVIGQRGWECENVVDLLERCPTLRDHVHEIPRCPDPELATFLAHAQALLFPSFAEGSGLPLLESLGLGTPVIASDLPAFREAAPDLPDYLDPLDGPGWIEAVLDYARAGDRRRAAQLERIRRWRPPTWDDHFLRFERLLEQAR